MKGLAKRLGPEPTMEQYVVPTSAPWSFRVYSCSAESVCGLSGHYLVVSGSLSLASTISARLVARELRQSDSEVLSALRGIKCIASRISVTTSAQDRRRCAGSAAPDPPRHRLASSQVCESLGALPMWCVPTYGIQHKEFLHR